MLFLLHITELSCNNSNFIIQLNIPLFQPKRNQNKKYHTLSSVPNLLSVKSFANVLFHESFRKVLKLFRKLASSSFMILRP